MRIDYVNGLDEFDGSLWFFNGKYAGHDDQIDWSDFASNGTSRLIDFHHRTIKPGIDPEQLFAATSITEIEQFLNEEIE